jgi:hypothetical protein
MLLWPFDLEPNQMSLSSALSILRNIADTEQPHPISAAAGLGAMLFHQLNDYLPADDTRWVIVTRTCEEDVIAAEFRAAAQSHGIKTSLSCFWNQFHPSVEPSMLPDVSTVSARYDDPHPEHVDLIATVALSLHETESVASNTVRMIDRFNPYRTIVFTAISTPASTAALYEAFAYRRVPPPEIVALAHLDGPDEALEAASYQAIIREITEHHGGYNQSYFPIYLEEKIFANKRKMEGSDDDQR